MNPVEHEHIVDVDVSAEMESSFLDYAYSVIYSRALPDARDGLKPVQRRILYQMGVMGLRPDKGHVKCARVVGEVMGKLHPHGDTAIYDAMVRLAQPWVMRVPLVDGHGNFGSLDDGPAAARYTESRLAPAALDMTRSLDEDVVDFVPNYDAQYMQPEVLPASFPNLLVNGSDGIAVGMATKMPPHNLGEVVAAVRHLIANPEATLEELIRFVPGPDFPMGGKIVGLEGIREAYATGRGIFRTRAKARIENVTARKRAIVVTELPFQVGPEKVIDKIKDAVQAKKITGITSVTDLSDRDKGLRLVIEIKNTFNPDAILEQLYRFTPLEESFGINNVALVDGQPRTLGLRELLQVYVDFRLGVVRRRTAHRLAARRGRLHLVEGLLIAILDIDEVIQVIRSSDDSAAAKARLMAVFDLSDAQAEYILELQLRRLTKFSRLALENEKEELLREIAELQEILGSDARLRQVVSEELAEVAARLATPRRTILLEESGAAAPAASGAAARRGEAPVLEIADSPCTVLLSGTDLIARVEGEIGRGGPRRAHDAIRATAPATTRGTVGLITSAGRLIRESVADIPGLAPVEGSPGLAGGSPVSEMVALPLGEQVVGLVSLDEDTAPPVLATADGVIKRVDPANFPGSKNDFDVIALKDGDRLIGVASAADEDHIVLITSDGQLLHFPAGAVRPQGRTAGGMAGVKLAAGASVVALAVVPSGQAADAVVVTVTGQTNALPGTVAGSAKVTPFASYPAKGRATMGVRAHRFLRGEDVLQLAWAGIDPRAVGGAGQSVDLPAVDERRDGSGRPLAAPVVSIG